jgi:NAD(P)-dependent dehydrogenase (short-subunit alcohol dehydrogenase family)
MIAQAFANNGARVYIASRRKEVLEQSTKVWGSSLLHPKGRIIPMQVDISDKGSIQSLVQEISSKEKWVDVLVNNAGISEGTSNVEAGDESAQKLSEELFNEDQASWENVYRTNVVGYCACLSGARILKV